MVESITINPETRTSKILFFDKIDLTQFTSNVIPLFGPNGAGKSTLLQSIIDRGFRKSNDVTVNITKGIGTTFFAYRNSVDNFKNAEPRTIDQTYDPVFNKLKWDARLISEGQSVIFSIMDLLDHLYNEYKHVSESDVFVVLDEIDSGLSIDNIDVVMRKIKRITRISKQVQLMLSFNNPRVLKWFPEVLSMYDGTKIVLHTEDDMLREIVRHKKEFDKIRKTSKGRPKVYE